LINFSSINRILFIRLSSLGDILLTTPLVRSLKNKYPQILIDFLLRDEYKDVYKNNPYINKIFAFSREVSSLPKDLLSTKYDLVVDLQNNFRSSGIRKKLNMKEVRIFNKRTLDKFLLVKFKINRLKNAEQISVRYAKALDNFELDNDGLDIFTGSTKSLISGKERKYIGIAPGSRHFTKMWPKDYYINLANKLNDEDFTVVLFGGNDDKKICEEISKAVLGSIDLSNDDDLLSTAANMKECRAVVCNDSGLMHAACAVKVPVLAFLGSTVKEFGFTPYKNKNFKPGAYQPLVEILENNTLTCRPCSHIGRENCPKKHFKCMLEITPGFAFNKLIELINS
jgi:heptosyltransferase-2